MIDEKLLFLNMATYYQQKMGYKASWIQVVFKEKFGVWPNELLKQKTPIESTDEFIEWVKKYQSRSFLNSDEITKKTLGEADKLRLYEKEERIEPTEEIISSFIKKIRDEVKTYVK